MSDLLAPGEFSLADKLQPAEYLHGRTKALQHLHRLDPALAAEVISYAWPHPASRQWTDDELYERLGTPRGRRQGGVTKVGYEPTETREQWAARMAYLSAQREPERAAIREHAERELLRLQAPAVASTPVARPLTPVVAPSGSVGDSTRRAFTRREVYGPLVGVAALGLGLYGGLRFYRSQYPTTQSDLSEKTAQVRVAFRYLGKFAESFVDSYMPSMGAAFDAFRLERMRQQALDQAENVAKFPALHFTQPMMASYAMGGGAPVDAGGGSHHHHRHRHHTG